MKMQSLQINIIYCKKLAYFLKYLQKNCKKIGHKRY